MEITNRKRIDCVFMAYLAISLACSVSFLSPLCRDSPPFLPFYACHSRILIVRARIAHGEINVFDGANFITITVTRIIKLCYCSAVCLPSSCELRATRHEDRQKTKDNSCHYLDRHKKSHEASPSTFFKHQIRSISCQQLLCSFWWKSRSFISRRHLRRKGPRHITLSQR